MTTLADLPDVLTVDEAAKILRISRSTAYAAVRKGDLPVLRIGRRILIPKANLMTVLDMSFNEMRPFDV
jgi:excisionase family DNA binding protein